MFDERVTGFSRPGAMGVAPAPCAPPPILEPKDTAAPSVFEPEGLVREGRRQLGRTDDPVPRVCLLDPDGDVVRYLRRAGLARLHPGWACYHTELWASEHDGVELGVVGCAVGAPFAVLVAEELAVSGCALVVSVTSSGQITTLGAPPYHVLIERAWRDEGTSLHYMPPSPWSHLDPRLGERLIGAFDGLREPVRRGVAWTTDAPFRESAPAIAAARRAGCHVVEMEAAALYAYARARGRDVVCLAHVTNTMAVAGEDFEKGPHAGALVTLDAFASVARALHPATPRLPRRRTSRRVPDSAPIPAQEHWDAAYERGADRVSWHQDEAHVSLELIAALDLAGDTPVIDIGGGVSSLAASLLDRGHIDLSVLDVSARALDAARERLDPRAERVARIHADLRTWRPTRRYGVWHDRAVLHFLTDIEDQQRYAELIAAALEPGAHAIIATFGPDGPERCSGLPVVRYSADDLDRLLGDRFERTDHRYETHRTPGGSPQQFTWIVARRTESP